MMIILRCSFPSVLIVLILCSYLVVIVDYGIVPGVISYIVITFMELWFLFPLCYRWYSVILLMTFWIPSMYSDRILLLLFWWCMNCCWFGKHYIWWHCVVDCYSPVVIPVYYPLFSIHWFLFIVTILMTCYCPYYDAHSFSGDDIWYIPLMLCVKLPVDAVTDHYSLSDVTYCCWCCLVFIVCSCWWSLFDFWCSFVPIVVTLWAGIVFHSSLILIVDTIHWWCWYCCSLWCFCCCYDIVVDVWVCRLLLKCIIIVCRHSVNTLFSWHMSIPIDTDYILLLCSLYSDLKFHCGEWTESVPIIDTHFHFLEGCFLLLRMMASFLCVENAWACCWISFIGMIQTYALFSIDYTSMHCDVVFSCCDSVVFSVIHLLLMVQWCWPIVVFCCWRFIVEFHWWFVHSCCMNVRFHNLAGDYSLYS